MNCLLVPTLAFDTDLLTRLANSIDYPIQNKVILNNGKPNALNAWHRIFPDWKIIECGRNLGVAASWNQAPKIFTGEDAWLIVNDDFHFQPGQLELICHASDNLHTKYPTIHFTVSQGYNCFIWTRKAVNEIGLFDENFYPAYFEDYDYRIRMQLAGLSPFIVGLNDSEITHGKPYSGNQRYRELLDAVDRYARDYFTRKWNHVSDTVDDRTFRTPYNFPNTPLSYWQLDTSMRLYLSNLWHHFINVPNPSIK